MHPFVPMSPLLTDEIPSGSDWVHQLKWDGFRTIASVEDGRVELYSKKMLSKNKKYPDLVQALSRLKGDFLLDGEAVILDPKSNRPNFQFMQQRDKLTDTGLIRMASERQPVQYIVFDLLRLNGEDLRHRPFRERHGALKALAGSWGPPFFLTDVFEDGHVLWDWVVKNGWEGVVSKRLSGTYKEGKEHRDWRKRKTMLRIQAEAVGILMKEGRMSSLVMRKDGAYLGRVSSGLNARSKEELSRLPLGGKLEDYFPALPDGIKGFRVIWLEEPLVIEVTGLEMTQGGALRHPKLLAVEGIRL